ncbi:MAG: hypothetical protein KF729_36660 [Sandaracinaceae bacterium]|nr:hypothetical protein [Sandaracinaceae bacterium]
MGLAALALVLIAVMVVAGAAALFAFVIGALAGSIARYRRATEEVLPLFARTHGLRLHPHGAPDRLPKVEGRFASADLEVELYRERVVSPDPESGLPRLHFHICTRVTARGARDPRFVADVGSDAGPSGWSLRSGGPLPDHLGAEVAALAARRSAVLHVEGGRARVEWPGAEDDLEALEAAVVLAVGLVSEHR